MLPEIIKTSELWGPLSALTIFILMLILAITTQVILQLLIRKRRNLVIITSKYLKITLFTIIISKKSNSKSKNE